MASLEAAEKIAILMQHVGFAVWQLQELETTLATYVVLRLRDSRGVGRERGLQLQDSAERRTLGSLLREVSENAVIAPELLERLEKVIEERNWLVHRARRESRGLFASEEVFADLDRRTQRLSDDALALLKEVGAEVETFVRSSGVDRDWVDREAARLAAEWGL